MPVTGERGKSQQQLATSLLNVPIVSQVDLLNPDSLINQQSSSGKKLGAVVYVLLPSGILTTAVSQGPSPEDAWDISKQFIDKLNKLKVGGKNDGRWLAIAKTDMQAACMAACRSVAQPSDES